VTKGRRCDPYRAPSWSWASIEILDSKIYPFAACIPYEMVIDKGFVPDLCLKILEAESTATTESPYGQVTGGRLRVQGASMPVSLTYAVRGQSPVCLADFDGTKEVVHLDIELQKVRFGNLMKDSILPRRKHLKGLLLGTVRVAYRSVLDMALDKEILNKEIRFGPKCVVLLLETVDPILGIYERVGIAYCPVSDSRVSAAAIECIEIV
jgi:hypothetical protein